ncbi:MAG: glycosyltransferase family 4 protein [Myxococcales bacterium]|nr:glycosyltransferase family 4 protein [Myxococcales bacterium]
MRIAQVSPLHESVPPGGYGGTERVVSYLTEELVRRGNEVTLFASGDSLTSARLVPACPRALRTDPSCGDRLPYHVLMLEQLIQRAEQFDVVHFHTDHLHLPAARRLEVASLTTLHGRLDRPELQALFGEFPESPVVSISDAQRGPLPWLNWVGTVHHGLPEHLYRFRPAGGDYLAFLGRVAPEKRLDRAIEIARRSGFPLKVAAKVEPADQVCFEGLRPRLSEPHVEFLGEIGEAQKAELLGHALGLLFPIDWPEPFGLVMIESLACGTPVVAYRCGSVPEVVEHGVTGFVVDGVEAAVEACRRLGEIDRRRCRLEFERRFAARRMADDYLRLYAQLLGRADAQRAQESP